MVGWLTWLRFKLGVPSVIDRQQQLLMDIRKIDSFLENLNFQGYEKIDVWDEDMDFSNFHAVFEPCSSKRKEEEIHSIRVHRVTGNFAVLEGGMRIELKKHNSVRAGECVTVKMTRDGPTQQWQASLLYTNEHEDSLDWTDDPEVAASVPKLPFIYSGRAIRRVIATTVQSINQRIITVSSDNLSFDMDQVECNFILRAGDYLELGVVYEVDHSSSDMMGPVTHVETVKPLCNQTVEGYVTYWRNNRGEIISTPTENRIAFELDQCDIGYIPCLWDHVIVDSIKCKQGDLMWRAQAVILFQRPNKTKQLNADAEVQELLLDKIGLEISSENNIGVLSFGEKKNLKVLLANRSKKPVRIVAVFPHPRLSPHSQFKLHKCPRFPYMLPAEAHIDLVFLCTAKNLGTSRDLFVLEFEGGVRIGRYLQVEVLGEHEVAATLTSKQWQFQNSDKVEGPIVKGQRSVKLHPFRRRLQRYKISDEVYNLAKFSTKMRGPVAIQDALYEAFPSFVEELSADNYTQRLHELLELEEAEVSYCVERWSADSVELKQSECGKYYLLDVSGLSEGRPSLMPGDSVICKHIFGGINYEGVIYKTMLCQVMLKFAEMFPCPEKDDRFFVKFSISRTPFLRLHAAVDAAWRELGPSILFPTFKITLHKPQIDLKDELYRSHFDRLENGNKSHLSPDDSAFHTKYDNIPTDLQLLARDSVKVEQASIGACQEVFSNNEQFSASLRDMAVTACSAANAPVCVQAASLKSTDLTAAAATGDEHFKTKSITQYKENLDDEVCFSGEHLITAETVQRKNRHRVELDWINICLNESQRSAICNILRGEARPLPYIIFGPPGTGKTMTIVETILQINKLIPDSRVLVGTPSNSAADLLAIKLLESSSLLPGSLIRLVSYSYKDSLPAQLKPYKKVTGNLDIASVKNSSTLGLERITVGTCAALGSLIHNNNVEGKVTHVLLDEAGQATEADSMLVAALLGQPRQIILAGDPMQLGPVIQGRFSAQGGLGISFLARLLRCGPYNRDPVGFPKTQGYNPLLVTMLVKNYRSVPEILALPARLFYHNELLHMVSQENSIEGDLLSAMKDDLPQRQKAGPPALVFHGVRGRCEREEDSPSWFNASEVNVVVQYMSKLYVHGLEPQDVGVISPYNKQVQKLRSTFYNTGLPIPKVGSVEEFQGQERMCVIFSAVRSSEDCKEEGLGFLANPNRMNTAITRARALLIVIGDPYLLYQDPSWGQLIEYCVKRNAYRGCDLPPELCLEQKDVDVDV